MKNNLLSQYKNIIKSEDRWKYYKNMQMPSDIFSDQNDAESFIHNYFGTGGKGAVFVEDTQLDRDRLFHIVSVFFLGIHLKDVLLKDDNQKKSLKPDFRYLWYLASLFHDYGYIIENNKDYYAPKDLQKLEDLKKRLKISSDLLSIKNNTPKFSIPEIEGYYHYGTKERGFVNHGIAGGLLLYDRLIKNYNNERERYCLLNGKDPLKIDAFINDKNLSWGKHQFDYFNKVAWAIINHNIWFCCEDDSNCKNLYVNEKYSIQNLIITEKNANQKKHNKETDPFLFLLIITDTIEPVKHFKDIKAECVLEKIQITTNPKKQEIIIEVLDECINFTSWFKKIKTLETWVQITVEYTENKLILANFD